LDDEEIINSLAIAILTTDHAAIVTAVAAAVHCYYLVAVLPDLKHQRSLILNLK
jgi:hypothetical protein